MSTDRQEERADRLEIGLGRGGEGCGMGVADLCASLF